VNKLIQETDMDNAIKNPNKYGPANVDRLSKFIAMLPVNPPDEFLSFVQKYNCGEFERNVVVKYDEEFSYVHETYGIVDEPSYLSLEENYEEYSSRIGSQYLPFADDPGGNIYCLSLSKNSFGHVFFWDHEFEGDKDALTYLSDSFENFVDSLVQEELPPIEKIFASDDCQELEKYIYTQRIGIEDKNEIGRTMIELASINAATECIKFLHSKGAKPGKSQELAKRNAQFFEEHKPIVMLLKSLYPDQ
jgi:hypothetical protein